MNQTKPNQTKPNQTKRKLVKAKPFGTFLLAFIMSLTFTDCQNSEEIIVQNDATIYKENIVNYFDELTVSYGKNASYQIKTLQNAIELNTLKIYDTRTNEILIIANSKPLDGLEGISKFIFYLNNNKIVRSNIVTLKQEESNNDLNKVILAVLNNNKNGFKFTGEIKISSLSKTKLLENSYSLGVLNESAVMCTSKDKSKTSKINANCYDYYWVVKYGNEIISQTYLYTICDCSGGGKEGYELFKTTNCNDSQITFLGASSTSTSPNKPSFPTNPFKDARYSFTDIDGVHTEYKFNSEKNIWQITNVLLPAMVISRNKDNYGILDIKWPLNNHKVFDPSTNLLYSYEASSDYWNGVPIDNVSQAIEENIDDSQLDPCTKGIMDQLKNTANNDIAKMISRFGQPGSIFNINIILGVTKPNNFAETSKVNGSELDINIILNRDYIDGTYYYSRPTDLSIATTLTHEIIHAYLISATSEFHTGCGLTICDFATIFDAYVAYQATKNPNTLPDAHEEIIATKYLNTIAETVQEFHTGKPVAAGMATQVYTDLAMSGLWGTKYFNTKYPDNPNDSHFKDRIRIINRIQAERSGTNFSEITLTGIPCKK